MQNVKTESLKLNIA